MSNEVLKLSDRVTAKLNAIAEKLGSGHVNVGFLEGDKYLDGTTAASVAFWNEFGTSAATKIKIPARPFFRPMIAKESPEWPTQMAKIIKAKYFDGPAVLAIMGASIADALKESIESVNSPALAASTVKAKGFAKPLVDTGKLIDSPNYEVVA